MRTWKCGTSVCILRDTGISLGTYRPIVLWHNRLVSAPVSSGTAAWRAAQKTQKGNEALRHVVRTTDHHKRQIENRQCSRIDNIHIDTQQNALLTTTQLTRDYYEMIRSIASSLVCDHHSVAQLGVGDSLPGGAE